MSLVQTEGRSTRNKSRQMSRLLCIIKTNILLSALKKFGHLSLSEPDSFVFHSHFQRNGAVWLIKDDFVFHERIFILFYPFTFVYIAEEEPGKQLVDMSLDLFNTWELYSWRCCLEVVIKDCNQYPGVARCQSTNFTTRDLKGWGDTLYAYAHGVTSEDIL